MWNRRYLKLSSSTVVVQVTMVGKILEVFPEKAKTRLKILDDSGEMLVVIWRQNGDEVSDNLGYQF